MSIKSEKSLPCKLFDPADKIPDFQIGDVTREKLCFGEDLIIGLRDESTSITKPVGSYCVSLESVGPEDTEFMVQVSSSLTVNDYSAGSKLLSSITAKLHCLEERRREFKHQEDGLNEKTLYIGLEDDLYHLEGEDLCPCDKTKWQKDLALCLSSEMISEGANILLMRYLAIKNFGGSLSFKSVMIEGQLTTCDYKCSEARSMKFNDHIVDVYTIKRRIQEECGLVHNTETHMTCSGYILRHDLLEVPYSLIINTLIDPNEIGQTKKSKFIAPLRSRWNSDIQMMSMYLDKKTCNIAQQSEYLTEHPEIKQLISDYTQTLLAVKPSDVLSFTIQHFAAFAQDPDPSEIDASGESNLDILTTEGNHRAQSSFYPLRGRRSSEFSPCSVFSKCPSSASCAKRSSGDSITTSSCSDDCKGCKSNRKKNNSLCSFYEECEKTCRGCENDEKKDNSLCSFHSECDKTCKGCTNDGKKDNSLCSFHKECENTCRGCENDGKKDNSLCSFHSECDETCKGCTNNGKKDNSLCSLHSECDKTCKGCTNDGKKDNSLCSFHKECDKTCKGCTNDGKKDNSLCSFHKECENTCRGCENDGKKDNSLCSFHSECDETCKGCTNDGRKDKSLCSFHPECDTACEGCQTLRKPCSVHKACPECPGCD